ncbi:MAG TPA: aminomethyl-transferring glycine dehydrogenase subunit GcvPA [Actinomycetota bacterium]|nr:aminomethyl-transferring glycine dehydrogenase subunit GcvPA [Actinomycetota bacterium]
MRFAPHTDTDVREMLDELGLSSVEDLYAHIPADVSLDRPLDIPSGVSELELLEDLRRLAARNRHADDLVCFAGGGAYDHYVPSVVWALAGRSELQTSYTPYQPELSQGVLQATYEYQSMICELTDLEVSNASLYDGPTALMEAVNLSRAATGRDRVLVAGTLDARHAQTLEAYGRGAGYTPEILEADGGRTRAPEMRDDLACVVVQHPNAFGILEPAREIFAAARRGGARAIHVFDPLALGVLASPGELGADIAVAEGHVLGNHLNLGGPYLGVMAARLQDVRRMPGRIAGETLDADGHAGYVLTLQAREQHIRREKATSNICTNQTLMAIAAAVYLAWLGPQGLREVGEASAAKARYAADRLTEIDGVRLAFPGVPFFKEFAVSFDGASPNEVRDRLVELGLLAGPVVDGSLLVACTERRTREEIDLLAAATREALS